MDERQWMTSVLELLTRRVREVDSTIEVSQGAKLPYANEILSYSGSKADNYKTIAYETDLLVFENLGQGHWKPRVVIEGKLGRITTHDAITYSEKAFTHKNVHPYLRYGILLGNRRHYPLPGRLFRHGAYFDFMFSCVTNSPSTTELNDLMDLICDEIVASRNLEEILFNSRNPNRKRYTILHRPLRLK